MEFRLFNQSSSYAENVILMSKLNTSSSRALIAPLWMLKFYQIKRSIKVVLTIIFSYDVSSFTKDANVRTLSSHHHVCHQVATSGRHF